MLAAAIFAIGAAFAAQTTSEREDREADRTSAHSTWVPGTNGVQAVYESGRELLAPPR